MTSVLHPLLYLTKKMYNLSFFSSSCTYNLDVFDDFRLDPADAATITLIIFYDISMNSENSDISKFYKKLSLIISIGYNDKL